MGIVHHRFQRIYRNKETDRSFLFESSTICFIYKRNYIEGPGFCRRYANAVDRGNGHTKKPEAKCGMMEKRWAAEYLYFIFFLLLEITDRDLNWLVHSTK